MVPTCSPQTAESGLEAPKFNRGWFVQTVPIWLDGVQAVPGISGRSSGEGCPFVH